MTRHHHVMIPEPIQMSVFNIRHTFECVQGRVRYNFVIQADILTLGMYSTEKASSTWK